MNVTIMDILNTPIWQLALWGVGIGTALLGLFLWIIGELGP